MAVTITIPFPGPQRDRAPSLRPDEAARRPDPVRSALVSLGWAVAVEVVEDLVPGLGVAVALVHLVRAACATGPDDRRGEPPGDGGGGEDGPIGATVARCAGTGEVAA